MTFWDFWHAHPFLAWCALWLLWGVVTLALMILRTVRIALRGWPSAHCDADGDFRPTPTEGEGRE